MRPSRRVRKPNPDPNPDPNQACETFKESSQSLTRALELYEAMRLEGMRLDTRSLLAFDRLCQAHGRPDLAAKARGERSMEVQRRR